MKARKINNKKQQIAILSTIIGFILSCSILQPSLIKTDGESMVSSAPEYKSADTLLYFENDGVVWIMRSGNAEKIAVLSPQKPEDVFFESAVLSPDKKKIAVGTGMGVIVFNFSDKENILVSLAEVTFPRVVESTANLAFWSPDSTKLLLRDAARTNLYEIDDGEKRGCEKSCVNGLS